MSNNEKKTAVAPEAKTTDIYIIEHIDVKEGNIIDVYINKTNNFNSQKSSHKSYVKKVNSKRQPHLYGPIRAKGGWGAWNMRIIEKFSHVSRTELNKRIQHYIDLYKKDEKYNVLNKVDVYISPEENKHKNKESCKNYYYNNIEKSRTRNAENYKKNKDIILEKQKEYNSKTEVKERNKANKAIYYEENAEYFKNKANERYHEYKEDIALKRANNYKENKETISEKRKVKIQCEYCGLIYRKTDKARQKCIAARENSE